MKRLDKLAKIGADLEAENPNQFTVRCPACEDTGFRFTRETTLLGDPRFTASPCHRCNKGLRIHRGSLTDPDQKLLVTEAPYKPGSMSPAEYRESYKQVAEAVRARRDAARARESDFAAPSDTGVAQGARIAPAATQGAEQDCPY